jgi:uncharacterized membrane protein
MLLTICRFIQLLFMGLYTGILFGDRIGISPVRPKLPATSFVLLQQDLHLRFGKLMPVLLFGSLLSGIVVLILRRRDFSSRAFIFTAVAVVCTALVVILTLLINVPVNETLMTWQAATPPENVMQLWEPWEGSHTLRTLIALVGLAALSFALASRPDSISEMPTGSGE